MNKAMRIASIPSHTFTFGINTGRAPNLTHGAEQRHSLLRGHIAQLVIGQFTLGNAVPVRVVVEVVRTPFDKEYV